MVGLDQNSFFGLSKFYLFGNDFNGIVMKYALENIFNGINVYLDPLILRINIIIAQEAMKSTKKASRKNELFEQKILERAQGKKIKNFKSCIRYSIKDWCKFGMLFLVRSYVNDTVSLGLYILYKQSHT